MPPMDTTTTSTRAIARRLVRTPTTSTLTSVGGTGIEVIRRRECAWPNRRNAASAPPATRPIVSRALDHPSVLNELFIGIR